MSHMTFLALCGVALGTVLVLLYESFQISIYRYRSVFLCAAVPLLLAGIIAGLFQPKMPVSQILLRLPGQFAQISVVGFALLFIWMAVSNVVLIRQEGMALKNTVGTMLYLGVILSVLCAYLFLRLLERAGIQTWICTFLRLTLYGLITYFECILLGIMVMGWVAVVHRPKYDKDFIIIPGCSISKTGGLLPLLRGRVNRAIRYAWDQEIATQMPVAFVPSGGQGSDEIMSEGSAMELYLLSHAAEPEEVFPEKKSVNTRENFRLSAEIIRRQKPDAKVAFATTNYHVFRCGLLARQAGMDAEGIASSTKWYFWPNGFAREMVAVCVMTRGYHAVAAAVIAAGSLLYAVLI